MTTPALLLTVQAFTGFGFVGIANTDLGTNHPQVFANVAAAVGMRWEGTKPDRSVAGLLWFEHEATVFNDGAYDLFDLGGRFEADGGFYHGWLTGGVRIWRTWICRGTSCDDPPGPGQKFWMRYPFTFGIGIGLNGDNWRAEIGMRHSTLRPWPLTGTYNDIILRMGVGL